jgi:hypothetical protein
MPSHAGASYVYSNHRSPCAYGWTYPSTWLPIFPARSLRGHVAKRMLCDVCGMTLLSHFPALKSDRMLKGRKKELWDKAEAERQRCRQWLLDYIRPGQPRCVTKAALRDAAMRELKVSKNSFDSAWIGAIEDTGRHDWYEPIRGQSRIRQ